MSVPAYDDRLIGGFEPEPSWREANDDWQSHLDGCRRCEIACEDVDYMCGAGAELFVAVQEAKS